MDPDRGISAPSWALARITYLPGMRPDTSSTGPGSVDGGQLPPPMVKCGGGLVYMSDLVYSR